MSCYAIIISSPSYGSGNRGKGHRAHECRLWDLKSSIRWWSSLSDNYRAASALCATAEKLPACPLHLLGACPTRRWGWVLSAKPEAEPERFASAVLQCSCGTSYLGSAKPSRGEGIILHQATFTSDTSHKCRGSPDYLCFWPRAYRFQGPSPPQV